MLQEHFNVKLKMNQPQKNELRWANIPQGFISAVIFNTSTFVLKITGLVLDKVNVGQTVKIVNTK